jgi:hypothetical protein
MSDKRCVLDKVRKRSAFEDTFVDIDSDREPDTWFKNCALLLVNKDAIQKDSVTEKVTHARIDIGNVQGTG